ncbi:unnamed protein product, partial [Leptidea sinapis]
HDVVARCCQR